MKLLRFLGGFLFCVGCVTAIIGLLALLLPMVENEQLQLVLASFGTPSDNAVVNAVNTVMSYALNNCYVVMLSGAGSLMIGAVLILFSRAPKDKQPEAHAAAADEAEAVIEDNEAYRLADADEDVDELRIWRPGGEAAQKKENPYADASLVSMLKPDASGKAAETVKNPFAPVTEEKTAAYRKPKEARGKKDEKPEPTADTGESDDLFSMIKQFSAVKSEDDDEERTIKLFSPESPDKRDEPRQPRAEYEEPPREYAEPPHEYAKPPLEYTTPPRTRAEAPRAYAEPTRTYSDAEPTQAIKVPPRTYTEPTIASVEPPRAYTEPPQAPSEQPRAYAEPPCVYAKPPRASAEPPRTYTEPPRATKEPPRTYAEPPRSYAEPPRAYAEPPRPYSEPYGKPAYPPSARPPIPERAPTRGSKSLHIPKSVLPPISPKPEETLFRAPDYNPSKAAAPRIRSTFKTVGSTSAPTPAPTLAPRADEATPSRVMTRVERQRLEAKPRIKSSMGKHK